MTKFEFTHEWVGQGADFQSSSVDNVWFNANTGTTVLDWNDNLYAYTGTSLSEARDVVKSYSVGNAANNFKLRHGPGTKLGSFWNTDFNKVVVFVKETKAVSLSSPVATAATAVIASKDPKYTLYFDLNGIERTHVVTGKQTIDDAIKVLNDAAAVLGANIVVKKVITQFV